MEIEYVIVKQKDIPLILTFVIVCKTFPIFVYVDFGEICMAVCRSIITNNFSKDTCNGCKYTQFNY
jgi:hypothetical protein